MDKEEIKQALQEIEKENHPNTVEESSIDWKEAWLHRKFIIVTTVIFMVLGPISALTMKRTYVSTVTLVPELGRSSTSSISSITSMLGLGNMSMSNTSDAYNVMVYPEVVASTPFVGE